MWSTSTEAGKIVRPLSPQWWPQKAAVKAAVKIKIWLSIRIFALGRYMFGETGVSGCFNRVVSSLLPHFLNFPLKRHFKQDAGMLVAFGITL